MPCVGSLGALLAVSLGLITICFGLLFANILLITFKIFAAFLFGFVSLIDLIIAHCRVISLVLVCLLRGCCALIGCLTVVGLCNCAEGGEAETPLCHNRCPLVFR